MCSTITASDAGSVGSESISPFSETIGASNPQACLPNGPRRASRSSALDLLATAERRYAGQAGRASRRSAPHHCTTVRAAAEAAVEEYVPRLGEPDQP